MRYGICAASIGDYAEPGRVVEAAQAAEAAGWEALVWDHLAYAWGLPSADPWVVLAAAAQATTRLLLGTAVIHGRRGSHASMLARISAGPPGRTTMPIP